MQSIEEFILGKKSIFSRSTFSTQVQERSKTKKIQPEFFIARAALGYAASALCLRWATLRLRCGCAGLRCVCAVPALGYTACMGEVMLRQTSN
ncbi:hypothetical protein J6590_090395 [Homalodisca vitripennis]|nr:hypothetical protein J6590_090395 [Homalodisca vitripennis]